MWYCRWLLCLVVIGLATRGAFSMDEQPGNKNESSETTSSIRKEKSHDDGSINDEEQALHSSLTATTTSNVAGNLTNSNGAVSLVPDTGPSTSMNAAKPGSPYQSYSKRHFRHSILHRKEPKAKTRSSSTKSNVAIGNLTSFGPAENLIVPTRDILHNPDSISDSVKSSIESIQKSSITSTSEAPHAATTTGQNYLISAIASSRLPSFANGSEQTFDRQFDNTSSRVTAISSASSENSDSSSSSSGSESVVDEKSSSVELMSFTFDSVGKHDQSTSTRIEVIKRMENVTTLASVTMDRSPSKTMVPVQTTDRSIDKTKSTSTDSISGGIDLIQSIQSAGSDVDDDLIIYSVHTEPNRSADHLPNELPTSSNKNDMARNDSVASGSPGSNDSSNQSARRLRRTGDIGGYSWVSVNDSLNRISLADVIDTLKNTGSQETRGSYSYSNSTLSKGTNSSLDSRPQITDTGPVSTKHSRSLTIPDGAQSSREFCSSMSSDPGLGLSDQMNPLNGRIDGPFRLSIPLHTDEIAKARTKNNIVVEKVEFPKPSTSTDSSSGKIASLDEKIVRRKDEPLRFVLDLEPSSSRCSSDSSIDGLQNSRRIDSQNPFYQRRGNEMTLSASGSSISEPEQCLTIRASARTSLISPAISSNSDDGSRGASSKPGASKSSASAIDGNRGAQSLVSSGFIILENFEPVVRESLAPEEAVVPFETETRRTGHIFVALPDLEEHCNVSSSNVFIPPINSRKSISAIESGDESSLARRELQNLTTTEDSLYIIEGFEFLKNNADEFSELEDDFDRRREAFDYGETEAYTGYTQLDDHLSRAKLVDQIEPEAELPAKQELLIAAGLQWKGNVDDRNHDQWWLDDKLNRRTGRAKNEAAEKRTVLIQSGSATSEEEIRVIPSLSGKALPDMNESDINSYRIFLLPTAYVLIGVCVILFGCSIWCSKDSVRRRPNVPKLTYYIQEKDGNAEAVV